MDWQTVVRQVTWVQCGLFILIGIVNGLEGDWRKCAYSLLAGVINAVALL
jgi:hypothetical protein